MDRWSGDALRGWLALGHRPRALPVTWRRLLRLPADFSAVLARSGGWECPSLAGKAEGERSNNAPCQCLVCGALVCSHTYCCQAPLAGLPPDRAAGGCTRHAHFCGAGVGLFLRFRPPPLPSSTPGRKG